MLRYLMVVAFCVCSSAACTEEYVVKRGDTLTAIAQSHGVSVAEILRANGTYLLQKYGRVCGKKSAAYRESETRKGFFCNERKVARDPVHANTLMAGWSLSMPANEPTSKQITDVVRTVSARSVALVVDATGSMGGNIQRVANEYQAALRMFGKSVSGVWFFADGKVWSVESDRFVERYHPSGSFENTSQALAVATAARPELIILITDEPGDDWDDAPGTNGVPVIAHCLPENGNLSGVYTCSSTLRALVMRVPGSVYMEGDTQDQRASATVPPVRRIVPVTPSLPFDVGK